MKTKDTILITEIDTKTKDTFKKACKLTGHTMSGYLKTCILNKNEEYKKVKDYL